MDNAIKKQSSLKKKIDEELLCGICCERVNHPKTLTQCSHSFCQVCSEKRHVHAQRSPTKSLQDDELECPKCRTVTLLPEGRVANLPTIPALQSVVEILSNTPEGGEEEYQESCQKHGNVLNQYCGLCNELLCSECIHDPKQKEHFQRGEITLVRNILPQSLELLSKQLQPTRELESQAQGLKEVVEQKRKAVLANGEEAKATIFAFFAEVSKGVEERKKAFISAVDRNMNRKLATLDEHNQKLEVSKTSTRGITTRIKRLHQSRDIHAVTDEKIIQEKVLQLQRTLERLDSQLQNGSFDLLLKFQGDSSYEHHLGSIRECEADPDSSYLTIKHRVSVEKDGSVLKGNPAAPSLEVQYVPMMVAGQKPNADLKFTHSASLPRNFPVGLIWSSMPRSPSDGTLANHTRHAVPLSPEEGGARSHLQHMDTLLSMPEQT